MKQLLTDFWIVAKEFIANIFPQLNKEIPGPIGKLLALLGDFKTAWVFLPTIIGLLCKLYKKLNDIETKPHKRKK